MQLHNKLKSKKIGKYIIVNIINIKGLNLALVWGALQGAEVFFFFVELASLTLRHSSLIGSLLVIGTESLERARWVSFPKHLSHAKQ